MGGLNAVVLQMMRAMRGEEVIGRAQLFGKEGAA